MESSQELENKFYFEVEENEEFPFGYLPPNQVADHLIEWTKGITGLFVNKLQNKNKGEVSMNKEVKINTLKGKLDYFATEYSLSARDIELIVQQVGEKKIMNAELEGDISIHGSIEELYEWLFKEEESFNNTLSMEKKINRIQEHGKIVVFPHSIFFMFSY